MAAAVGERSGVGRREVRDRQKLSWWIGVAVWRVTGAGSRA